MSGRVPFIEGREQEACDIETLIAFLQDYPNVSNVFIVRRLVARVAVLIGERDRAMEDVARLEDAFMCEEHPDAIHMVRCTGCNQERHVPA